ncbi:hypothetical protein [Actinomycetospora chiangmaiensis]|uniref:COG4705 family protein n=1 Tax=Actinomycetospora chiangmaiensis TaxID=402650 RepID=UPI000360ADEA|nr:hypothetical protein [Actinomycetospora chiangmaiensis]
MSSPYAATAPRTMLNKVPEVTVWFWLIKVLCTTVGETAADFLNVDLGLGLTGTSVVTGVVLAILLALQLRAREYVPGLYWATVTLVSVFGTLVTDNLTDNLGVPLLLSSLVFGIALAVVFGAWYSAEGTLSIHAITNRRRETFYWLAIFVTFALGTATGDLMGQALSLGYVVSALVVLAVIAVVAIGWRLGLHPVLAFWIIYVLTRPLGASLGDLLAQPTDQGGLGIGTTVTSIVFLVAILGAVTYLQISRVDVIGDDAAAETGAVRAPARHGLLQTVVVVAVLLVLSAVGYVARVNALGADTAPTSAGAAAPGGAPGTAAAGGPNASLGDLSSFRTITADTRGLLQRGDQAGATNRVTDLETAWDQAQGRLQARDDAAWTRVDRKIDTVLKALRADNPDPRAETAALDDLLNALG